MDAEFVQIHKTNYHRTFTIHRTVQLNPWSERVFADCLESPYFAYKLDTNDFTIGYYVCLRVLDEATLMDIGVYSEYQGNGWGSKILEHFLRQCEKQKVATIWLEVRQSNHPAIHLYENAGFILVEQRKNYYLGEFGHEDALVMKYTVSKQA
jgi:ribosomal-protein-alanine N-acetyltransferase